MTESEVKRAPLLSARGISKQFGGVEVLTDVDLDLAAGEIHALLGENGAGKSTFAKIVAGVHRPTRGSLTLYGRPVDIANPIVAQKLGITLIHQEPISFPDLTVAENLALGRDARRSARARSLGANDARGAPPDGSARRRHRRRRARCAGSRSPTSRWSRSRARSPPTAASSSWTSRRRRSPRRRSRRCSRSRAVCATKAAR